MKTLLSKLRDAFQRRTRVTELDEEMRTHFELLVEEKIRSGLTEAEARRQAHLAFGNALVARENAGRALGWPAVESILQDLRLAARGLRRRPLFALSIIAILALGIGATSAIFTLVRGVMLESLRVPQPEELQLAITPKGRPARLSAPTIDRLAADPTLAGRVIGYSNSQQVALRLGESAAEPCSAQFVHGGFFTALRLSPELGRLLAPTDDADGQAQPVGVISERWWRTKFARDPGVIGRGILLNGQTITIVGVAAAAFPGVSIGDNVDIWLPSGLHVPLRVEPSAQIISDEPIRLEQWRKSDLVSWFYVLIRRPGSNDAQGALEAAWRPQLAAIQRVLDDPAERVSASREVPRLTPSPAGYSRTREDFRRAGLTLSLLVGAVVLVTVANASTLLLLRLLARRREMGVRLALGAGSGRLARWALLEALLLTFAGAVTGLLLGVQLTPLLAGWLVPNAAEALPGPDVTMLLGLGGLTLLLGLLLGAAPALLMSRLPPHSILQHHGVGAQGSLRLGRMLVVVQIVLSVLLVAAAGALALNLQRALTAPLGYARESVITTLFDLDAAGISRADQPAVLERLRAAAQTFPQVRAVGFAQSGALSGSISSSTLHFRGEGIVPPTESVQGEGIDPSYLGAMGMTLVQGRNLLESDGADRPKVALVSQRLARQVFGAANPLGCRFGYDAAPGPEDFEIVGVVADARVNGVRDEAPAMFFRPIAQSGGSASCLALRVEGDARQARDAIKRRLTAGAPAIMFDRWLTLEERVQRWVRNDLATVRLTTGFGVLSTLLSIIGVLGALGYLVATRSRDIAVRLALGAAPGRIWRDILRESLVLGAVGAGFGLVLAAILPHVLGSWMLTGLRTEWPAIVLASAVGLGAALLGGLIPAFRAARVNPLTLLRAE